MRRLHVDLERFGRVDDTEQPKLMNLQHQMRRQMLEMKFRVDQIIKNPTDFV
jgi:hypothetical protein